MKTVTATVILAFALLSIAGAGAVTGCANTSGCCKVCSTGKACGDTCISRAYECHVGAGCACDG